MNYLRPTIIALLALVVLGLLSGSGRAQEPVQLGIDADPNGNTATSLDTRQSCVSVSTGDTFQLDIFASDVDDLVAWELYLRFDPIIIEVVDADMHMFLASNPLSSLIVKSDFYVGWHFLGAADRHLLGASGSGVLARVTLHAKAPGLSHLEIPSIDFDGDGDIDKGPHLTNSQGIAVGDVTGDGVFDGPTFHAIVAVDSGCPVQIDVNPGSLTNPINLRSKGVVPVAILSEADFDATEVDASSVLFEGAPAVRSALKDVDGDGDSDMILHFRTQEANIGPADTQACFAGETIGGLDIEGCDAIHIVGPRADADRAR